MRNWKTEIQKDISQIKEHLDSGFQEIRSEMKNIREEHMEIRKTIQDLYNSNAETKTLVTSLQTSVQFCTDQYEDLNKKVETLKERNKVHSNLQVEFDKLANNYRQLQIELNANNQRDRLLNLEIVGVPEFKDENITELVLTVAAQAGVDITANDIVEANRVTPRNTQQGRPRNLVIKMKSRVIKDNIISGARKNRLSTRSLNIPGASKPVYVNEHLTYYNKQLLKKCKETANNKHFQFVWIRHSRIFMRKADGCPPVQILSEKDLSKLT
ncbi:uncharacterized protein LOC128674541 [Plodia interpunctella]|uniref:uncharacterized protein LOC128674541 n=1 Tax=Plodia interpunctella TaxID=58824 RepID=UPI002367B4E8|nr:uncharacterized protein LOC128674541 [Plodia interpunctella]